MFTFLARRLTFANTLAAIALFVSLGGTGYAALTITGRNVTNGSLTGADIRNHSVTGADIRAGTLLAKDFKAGELRLASQGPSGGADMSNFYDRATSDARFLGATAQAVDANKVDGVDSSALTTRGTTTSKAPGFGVGALSTARTLTITLESPRPVLLLAGTDLWSYNGQCNGYAALSVDGTLDPGSYATGTAAAAPNVNTYANISTSAMPTLAAGTRTILLKTASYGACVGFQTARLHAITLDG
jgi:hypothetical protein